MQLYRKQPAGTVNRARVLRKAASELERRLPNALRAGFADMKWRHQAPVRPFSADILCFSEALVIEVDGDTQVRTTEYDRARTAYINDEGLTVIRFTNPDVMQNIDGVLAAVSLPLREREARGAGMVRATHTEKGEPA